jgi:hypothetical protein
LEEEKLVQDELKEKKAVFNLKDARISVFLDTDMPTILLKEQRRKN